MSHPDDETLVGIALEPDSAAASSDSAAAARDHVRSCAECSAVVTEIRGVRDQVNGTGPVVWEQPDTRLWEGIERTVAEGPVSGASADDGASEQVRTERAELERALVGPPTPHAGRGRGGRWSVSLTWVVAAAVLGIVVGMGAAWSFWRAPTTSTTPTTIARTQLDTLDTRQSRGVAALEGTGQALDLRVDAATLNADGGYLEVWLINTDGKRMISLGVLREPGSDTFPVSQTIIAEGYVIVDISREPFDDAPQHSGDSLARGRLPA